MSTSTTTASLIASIGASTPRIAASVTSGDTVNASDPNTRISGSDVIRFDANSDDDVFVEKIKEIFNQSQFTLNFIYDKVGNKSTGYNMFYGLRQRHNMKLDVFERWLEILGYVWDVTVTKET